MLTGDANSHLTLCGRGWTPGVTVSSGEDLNWAAASAAETEKLHWWQMLVADVL